MSNVLPEKTASTSAGTSNGSAPIVKPWNRHRSLESQQRQKETNAQKQKKKRVTLKAAEEAAVAMGFTVMSAQKLKAAGVLGDYLTGLGAIKVAKARYAFAQDILETILGQCDQKIAEFEDEFAISSVLRTKVSAIEAYVSATEGFLKSSGRITAGSAEGGPTTLSFPPGAIVRAAVQTGAPPEQVKSVEVKSGD